jgi:hypothetical protein
MRVSEIRHSSCPALLPHTTSLRPASATTHPRLHIVYFKANYASASAAVELMHVNGGDTFSTVR